MPPRVHGSPSASTPGADHLGTDRPPCPPQEPSPRPRPAKRTLSTHGAWQWRYPASCVSPPATPLGTDPLGTDTLGTDPL
eukprot:4302351-Prymnesium_polylepis.1